MMPYISSPVRYPPTSSAPQSPSPSPSPKRKRERATDGAEPRSPLKAVAPNSAPRIAGMFMEDSDGDGENEDAVAQSRVRHGRAPARSRTNEHGAESAPLHSTVASISDKTTRLQSTNPGAGPGAGLGASLFSHSKSSTQTRRLPEEPQRPAGLTIRTSSGRRVSVHKKTAGPAVSYERHVAARSDVVAGKAQRSYYGIDIYSLMNEARADVEIEAAQAESAASAPRPAAAPSVERAQRAPQAPQANPGRKQERSLMWTEKYRPRKFTELVGDDRTHRSVMHWLKRWDDVVFPGATRPKAKKKANAQQDFDERPHRKILLLTGPPGLGKTTLAHVCARQAGYEVQEINASDERSRDVVKGRIRDMVGTENVKGTNTTTPAGRIRKAGRPVCVVVDEVDGVVSGSGGGGEGGFVKALIDLVVLDQRNSNKRGPQQHASGGARKRGDNFRLLRPLILVCNDVYHPSLRPLRQSAIAEVIHVRKPPLNAVVTRMQAIFDKEHVPFDADGVRKLCEAAWGVTSRKESGPGGSSSTGEGDIRGILVVGEWIAGKLRALSDPSTHTVQRLTRQWVEANMLADLSHCGGATRNLGRGGPREVVTRVFQEGAGFGKPSTVAAPTADKAIDGVKGVAEAAKAQTLSRLAEMISTAGDTDRIMTDCFTTFPGQPYQDDNYLSKPDAAYDWLHFHDRLSSQVYGSSEWELAPYLSQPILAFHALFATPASSRLHAAPSNPWDKDAEPAEKEPAPFSGPQASFLAHEAQKHNHALLDALRANLSLPISRLFSSPQDLATDFVPWLLRMIGPNIAPVVVGTATEQATASVRRASEKALVARAVNAMTAAGVRFERSRVEFDSEALGPGRGGGGWVYRMEPALDEFGSFATLGVASKAGEKVRYAVRQVLEQEYARESKRRAEQSRRARNSGIIEAGADTDSGTGPVVSIDVLKKKAVKRDFFGRVIAELTLEQLAEEAETGREGEGARKRRKAREDEAGDGGRTWVTFHEGFSNAVRKPVSLQELMNGL